MTPAELTAARRALGLDAAKLGRALELEGRDPGRSVRLWEAGRPMPGPARVAIRLMLAERARQSLTETVQAARAMLEPMNTPAPVLEALERLEAVTAPAPPVRPLSRRRSPQEEGAEARSRHASGETWRRG